MQAGTKMEGTKICRVRGRRVVSSLVLVLVVGVACSGPVEVAAGAEPPSARDGGGTSVSVTKVAQLPATLTGFTAVGSGADLVVADRRGLLWRLVRQDVDGATVPVLDPGPLLDISDEVSLLGERGMFSVVATPDESGLLVNYTALDGAITIEHFPYSGSGPIDRAKGIKLLELPHPYAWHHGGDMAFDSDGDLYVAVGDMEFRQIDPPGPQDPNLLLGGVLRIPRQVVSESIEGWEPRTDDMVARGLRNPWRLSIDRKLGDLWIGDVGLDTMEEVNRLPADDLGVEVANFGWPYFEGSRTHRGTPPAGAQFVAPVWEREQRDGVCGIVGGFVYRGESIEGLSGRYVYGDLCSGELRSFAVDTRGNATDDRQIGEVPETIISFGEDAGGELYALGASGGLYRLDPQDWEPDPNDQEPSTAGPTTTVVERSRQTCDGIVAAVLPLSELGSIDATDLDDVLAEVNRDIAELVPSLPGYLLEDGLVVQAALLEMSNRLSVAGGDPTVAEVQELRDAMLTGMGSFAGFPDSMARIVDAECG